MTKVCLTLTTCNELTVVMVDPVADLQINHPYKLSLLLRLFNSKTLLPSIKSLVKSTYSGLRLTLYNQAAEIYHQLPEKR